MPAASGWKLIAEQAGGALPGPLAAAAAAIAAKVSPRPAPTEIIVRIVLPILQRRSAYTPVIRPEVELTALSIGLRRALFQSSCSKENASPGQIGAQRRLRAAVKQRSLQRSSGAVSDQPKVIKVFIRSAGQTRLSGTLVKASKGGSLPLGRPTMWWLKWASTPAR
jgi:hypothetical protein